jgi:hypothetical protein
LEEDAMSNEDEEKLEIVFWQRAGKEGRDNRYDAIAPIAFLHRIALKIVMGLFFQLLVKAGP